MPDYIVLMDEHWAPDKYYVNNDVLKLMAKHLPEKHFEPGERYEYSNTGYVLLASIVERMSGVSFKEFVQKIYAIELECRVRLYRSRKRI